MWTPNRGQRVIRSYSGEFQDIDLSELGFQFPEKILEVFRNRNPINREFYGYVIKDGEVKYVSFFDRDFVDGNKSGRLKKENAHVIVPDNSGFASIPPYFAEYLSLRDKITVEGYDKVVRLWNPSDFLEYSESSGVEFDGDLQRFQKESYRFKNGL